MWRRWTAAARESCLPERVRQRLQLRVTERGTRLTLYPAIDLRRGRCVRLQQGSPDRETVYESDPFRVAERFQRDGAEWIHVVDLDAAFGEGSNRAIVAELARAVPLKIQTGGGLRTEADLAEILEGPIARAVIGTAAIEQPALVSTAVARWGAGRIAVGLDARGRRPAVRGWTEERPQDVVDLARHLAALGVSTFIYTDISRDGMFAGPNLDLSIEIAEATGADLIVSGGVSSPDDLDAVRAAGQRHPGIAGVIVGKAIYEGRVEVADAVRRMRARE
jgi:phosphoribosylformimino-5-aminoimidazole carboxamide ribotide isomerase